MNKQAVKDEPVSIPTYEEWVDWQDNDYDWWDWLLDDFCANLFSETGMDINKGDIYFDIYHRTCSSVGRITGNDLFIKLHHDKLMTISPTMTEIFREGMETIRWGTNSRDGLVINFDEDFMDNENVFERGIFAGMAVDDLLNAEGLSNRTEWYDYIEEVINDMHQDILKMLECEDEYRKSPEEYEEWKKANC